MPVPAETHRFYAGLSRFRPLRAALACALVFAAAAPAAAGSWVLGSSFDPGTRLATYFARFVAERGEGQMTVRCDATNGITIDTGVTGNGEAPAGVDIGGSAEATVRVFGGAGAGDALKAAGPVMIRADGAVMLGLLGDGATAIGVALLQPADHAEVTIGDITASVPLAGASDIFANIAKSCPAWPK